MRTPALLLLLFSLLIRAAAAEPAASEGLIAGDVVEISVYNHPDLASTIRIPVEGPVHLPLLGPVDGIQGLTVDALADRLRTLLEADYLRQAVVVATIKSYAPRRVYVMGSVSRPGAIDLDPGSPSTVTRAITAAGGLLDEADRNNVIVLREDTAGTTTSTRVSVSDREGSGQELQLRPNDLIIISRLDRVYITGQVMRPGAQSIPNQESLTVTKAISLAGGFDKYARQSAVQLLRPGESARTIDVEAILNGSTPKADMALRPGDTLYVPQRRF